MGLFFWRGGDTLDNITSNSHYRPVTHIYSHTAQISPGRKSLHEPLFVSDGFTIRSVIVTMSFMISEVID